jgi:hypothetical protein
MDQGGKVLDHLPQRALAIVGVFFETAKIPRRM